MKPRHAPFARTLDVLISAPAIIVALPICLILLLAIRLDSNGPPLFVQLRMGRHKRPFRMLKLRTMFADTASVASHEMAAGAVTPLGRVLRKLKLDELPQLWNVLIGQMSLVGPRPCLDSQLELIEHRDALGLFNIRPGVTGPAQLVGLDMSDPQRLAQFEAQYFSNPQPANNIAIILRTLTGSGRGDAVKTC